MGSATTLLETANDAACDWQLCSDIVRQHGRTFYFASKLLPRSKQRSIHAAYAFSRIADDLVDRAPEIGTSSVSDMLADWEQQVDFPRHPVAIAFAEVRARYDIPAKPVRDLFSGLRMDLNPAHFGTWSDLERYCYCVAGTIGLITAPILGCRDENALSSAVSLGIAMQLTNILRDIAEDARLGRLYLPLEELARFGVDPESVLACAPNGNFSHLVQSEIERARKWYAEGQRGMHALDPSGRFATLASAHLYSKILDQIETRGFDLFKERAMVSTARKVREMPTVAALYLRLMVSRPTAM